MARPRDEKHSRPTPEQLDERVAIPIDPEKAIEALLKVDPAAPPAEQPRKVKKARMKK